MGHPIANALGLSLQRSLISGQPLKCRGQMANSLLVSGSDLVCLVQHGERHTQDAFHGFLG